MKIILRSLFCILTIAFPAQRATATLLAYEGFDYAPGSTFINSNGGFGFSGIWLTNNTTPFTSMTNRGASLSYTDTFGRTLQTSGGSAYLTGGAGSCQPLRLLTNFYGPSSGTMWISFLGQRTGPVTNTVQPFYQRVASVQLHTNGNERVAVGRASYNTETGASTSRWDTWSVYSAGSGANLFASTNSLTNVTFLVLRIDYTAGLDSAYLFVNPPDLSTAPALAAASATNTGISDMPFDRIRLFAGNNNASSGIYAEIIVDELRVGDSFTDVAPAVGGGTAPRPRWTTINPSGTSLALSLTGGLGSNYVIEATATAENTNSWVIVGNLTLDGSGVGTFVDTNIIATSALRFYRARTP